MAEPDWEVVASEAYRSHGQATGRRDPWGRPLPGWDEAPGSARQAWKEAVIAAALVAETYRDSPRAAFDGDDLAAMMAGFERLLADRDRLADIIGRAADALATPDLGLIEIYAARYILAEAEADADADADAGGPGPLARGPST